MIVRNGSRCAALVLFSLVLATRAAASHEDEHGVEGSVSFQGSANAIGVVNRLDTTLGYRFNRFVKLSLGIPFYFVNPADGAAESSGTDSASGLGNVHADLELTLARSAFRFTSVLTGTAPTGDKVSGFSTGRGSVDWTNTFSNDFYWVVPYLSVGLANTVSDTSFFTRPFTSVGFVGHVDAGAYVRANRFSSVGVSAYKVLPSGEQTIVSRLVPRETTVETGPPITPPGQGRGRGRGQGQGNSGGSSSVQTFELVYETVGDAELAKDHGFSTWLSLYPLPDVDFYAGYSRSFPFDLNTFFFGASFNLGSMIRRARH